MFGKGKKAEKITALAGKAADAVTAEEIQAANEELVALGIEGVELHGAGALDQLNAALEEATERAETAEANLAAAVERAETAEDELEKLGKKAAKVENTSSDEADDFAAGENKTDEFATSFDEEVKALRKDLGY